jgi:hypothetical protein
MHQTKKGRIWHIAIKREKVKKMAEGVQKDKLKEAEYAKASIRAKVAHLFHTPKCIFGYTKVRFKGLVKNTSQIVMLFALGNLHRERNKLLELEEQLEQKKPRAVMRLKGFKGQEQEKRARKRIKYHPQTHKPEKRLTQEANLRSGPMTCHKTDLFRVSLAQTA